MPALNIHHEGINPRNFPNGDVSYYFRDILLRDIPVTISPSLHNYKAGQWNSKEGQKSLELIREIVKRPNSLLGQQGYTHKCKYNHFLVDPWHEFRCLWRKRISRAEQVEWVKRGREELEILIGATPELFSPPNHYFNETTLEVADALGYKFFSDQAITPLKPYPFGNMLVVPEGNLARKETEGRDAVYVHTDQIFQDAETIVNYREVINKATSMRDLMPYRVSEDEIKLNEELKYQRKRMRDITKAPRRFLKNLKIK